MDKLTKCKDVAISFLYLKPVMDERFPFITHHPFFSSSFSLYENELFNIHEDNAKFLSVCKEVEETIKKSDDVNYIYLMISKPYRLTFFKFVAANLKPKDFATLLRDSWVTMEFPNRDENVSLRELKTMFEKANNKYLMSKEELEALESLPDEITIYRGNHNNDYYDAMSWTLDKERAIWFANRFNNKGSLFTVTVPKNAILAYFKDSGEEEVVIDFSKINKKEIVKTICKRKKRS